MLLTSKHETIETLRKRTHRRLVFDPQAPFDVFDTRSRMTVFRRFREIGYLLSFSNGGRYYTLEDIPVFDDQGLWFHYDIGLFASRYTQADRRGAGGADPAA